MFWTTKPLSPRVDRRASRAGALAVVAIAFVAAGCETLPCHEPPRARCGIPDLCDPIVAVDPFPCDQCVPPKGVEPDHYGYATPRWRVLGEKAAACCEPAAPSIPAAIPGLPPPALPPGAVEYGDTEYLEPGDAEKLVPGSVEYFDQVPLEQPAGGSSSIRQTFSDESNVEHPSQAAYLEETVVNVIHP